MNGAVALLGACARESDARVALRGRNLGEYRGIWSLPSGELVHLFTDDPWENYVAAGWKLRRSAAPADGDQSDLLTGGA